MRRPVLASLFLPLLLPVPTGSAPSGTGRPQVPAGQTARRQLPTFSVDVEVVNVLVTVRDNRGAIVRDLRQDDFVVSEDGRPQTIKYFFRETDLPLTIGLLVDTTPSESNMLDVERRTSLAFLTRMLRPEKDAAFLLQYYDQVEVLQGLTSSIDDLAAAMWRLRAHDLEGPGGRGGRGPGGGAGPEGGFGPQGGGFGPRGGGLGRSGGRGSGGAGPYAGVLADAVTLASNDIMAAEPGRKALLVLGDGDHLGARGEEAVAAAQRADSLIYAIRIYDKDFGGGNGLAATIGGIAVGALGRGGGRGVGGPGGGMPPGGPGRGMNRENGKENLKMLARRTGGAYYEVGGKQTLDEIFGRIEEELRSQYSLGYTPDANAVSGYRGIKVEVRRKGMVVRGREGYYARAK